MSENLYETLPYSLKHGNISNRNSQKSFLTPNHPTKEKSVIFHLHITKVQCEAAVKRGYATISAIFGGLFTLFDSLFLKN